MLNPMIIVALYHYVIRPDDELCGAGLSLTSSVKTCILWSDQKLGKIDKIVINCSPVWQCGRGNGAVLAAGAPGNCFTLEKLQTNNP